MKRFLVLLVPLAFVHVTPATAQPEVPRASRESLTLTTNLLSPFFGAYYLEANLRASSVLGVLLNASHFSIENDEWTTRTSTLGAGLTYHFQGDALRRWYLEVQSELLFSPWKHEPSKETSSVVLGVSGAALAGYRFVCEIGPVLDLGAGVVVLHFPSAAVTSVSSPALTRVYPALKVNVGWAF